VNPQPAAPTASPSVVSRSVRAELTPFGEQTIVRFFGGKTLYGAVTMPKRAAEELAARIQAGEPDPGQITPEIAANVVWHHGMPGGYPPGRYFLGLMPVIAIADPINRAWLSAAYPGYVAAMNLAEQTGGIAQLQAIAAQDGPQ